jgi:hypothetical protein
MEMSMQQVRKLVSKRELKSGKFSYHDKFCAVSGGHWRNACRSHDTAPFASLEDAVGTIRRRAPRRNWRDIVLQMFAAINRGFSIKPPPSAAPTGQT